MGRLAIAVALWLPAAALAASPEQLAQLDALWAQRGLPDVTQVLEKVHRDALREAPGDFDLLWRAARERVWVADAAKDVRLKKAAGMEAWRFGEQAVAQRPERVEGHYYMASGMGAHAEAAGPMRALSLGIAQKFVEEMNKAAAIDAGFDRGGPLLALGRYNALVPWPVRNLREAETLLTQVRERFPENLRATHYLAELKLSQDDKQGAEALFAQVRDAKGDYDPAEASRVKAWLVGSNSR
ncbi:MAG: tetratricopeptide repeat protein [Myxococcaceae bacterium]